MGNSEASNTRNTSISWRNFSGRPLAWSGLEHLTVSRSWGIWVCSACRREFQWDLRAASHTFWSNLRRKVWVTRLARGQLWSVTPVLLSPAIWLPSMLMPFHYWTPSRNLACQSAWAYLALSKVPHPCSEENITFQKRSYNSASPWQEMLNSEQVFINIGLIVRLNRDGGAGALLVIAALHRFLKGLL